VAEPYFITLTLTVLYDTDNLHLGIATSLNNLYNLAFNIRGKLGTLATGIITLHGTNVGTPRELIANLNAWSEWISPVATLLVETGFNISPLGIQWPEQTIINIPQQARAKPDRKLRVSADNGITRPQTCRVFINLDDNFIIIQANDLSKQFIFANQHRFINPEGFTYPGP
jgi:hypothetical protein